MGPHRQRPHWVFNVRIVAGAFGAHALESGFCAVIPVDAPLGSASLSVVAQIGDHHAAAQLTDAMLVEPPPDYLSGRVRRDENWEYAIDGIFVDAATRVDVDADGVFLIPLDRPARLRMCVVDAAQGRLAPQAVIVRSGGRFSPAASGILRADVADALNAPSAAGFRCYSCLGQSVSKKSRSTPLVRMDRTRFPYGCGNRS